MIKGNMVCYESRDLKCHQTIRIKIVINIINSFLTMYEFF